MGAATIRSVRAAMRKSEFAPVYCFFGEDDFRKDTLVRELIDCAIEPSTRDFNLDTVRGSEVSAERLGSLLQTPPLLASRRVVVLRDAMVLKKDARAILDEHLLRPPPDTLLLLVIPAGGNPDRSMEEGTASVEVSDLRGEELGEWISGQVEKLGGAGITTEASTLLQSVVGGDSGQLANELDKLVSFTSRQAIDEGAVRDIVGVRRGQTLSDFLDLVAARDVAGAVQLVDVVLSQPKTTLVSIVMALTAQTLALSWGRQARSVGLQAHQVEREFYALLKETGAFPMRPWAEAVKCWSRSLSRWDERSLRRATAALRAADRSAKDTRLSSDEQLLANLVCTMCVGDARQVA